MIRTAPVPAAAQTPMPAPEPLPTRRTRVREMADAMREAAWAFGACDEDDLRRAGFSRAEIRALGDEARALAQGEETGTAQEARVGEGARRPVAHDADGGLLPARREG